MLTDKSLTFALGKKLTAMGAADAFYGDVIDFGVNQVTALQGGVQRAGFLGNFPDGQVPEVFVQFENLVASAKTVDVHLRTGPALTLATPTDTATLVLPDEQSAADEPNLTLKLPVSSRISVASLHGIVLRDDDADQDMHRGIILRINPKVRVDRYVQLSIDPSAALADADVNGTLANEGLILNAGFVLQADTWRAFGDRTPRV